MIADDAALLKAELLRTLHRCQEMFESQLFSMSRESSAPAKPSEVDDEASASPLGPSPQKTPPAQEADGEQPSRP